MKAIPSRTAASGQADLGSAITATLIIVVPLALALLCFAARLHVVELSHTVRAELLFALLLALMTTGMPVSIALGLSVLTYLFILSDVDPKMVGLKLFTSIDRFEIMAIPFFILAGNFLTTGGVARRMIDFATSLIGHWFGGPGSRGRGRLRAVCRDLRLVGRDRSRASARSCCPRCCRTAIRRASAPA